MSKLSFARRPRTVALAAALVLGVAGVGFAAAERLARPTLAVKVASAAETSAHAGFAPVVKKVLPAVVNVSSSKITRVPAGFFGGSPDDQFFQQFFGVPFDHRFQSPRQLPRQREQGVGSGVIATPDGYILTNNHVVDGASDVRVTLGDKREFAAKVVGTDPKSDIAVLKIAAAGLPAITFGDSSGVQIGDYALAIGDPFGVGQTVTMGIVSATGRSNLGIEDYEDFIQTDAPINPGNSGGALVNDRGELIGINTAIIAHGSEGNQGIGFAIPANMAREVMRQIVEHGKVTRAYLGIVPQDVTPELAKAFAAHGPGGALVASVSPDSPARSSGIERGDIILEVNGKPVTDSNSLRMTISMMAPGSSVNLQVSRNGQVRSVPVTLAELPGSRTASAQPAGAPSQEGLAGVSVEGMTPDTAHDLGLPAATRGVVVTRVDPASDAAEAGLQDGDVIQEVNRRPVATPQEFRQALRASQDKPLLLVNRHGNTMYVIA